MKKTVIILGLLVVLLTGSVAPSFAGRARAAVPVAHVAQTRTAFLDKTRFLADLGIAYFCIHHVYKNYKKGLYAKGADGRLRHIIVAGAVLALAYNRLHRAYVVANESNSPTLHKLVAPLNTVLGKVHGQQGDLAGGSFNDGAFQSMNGSADSLSKTATSNGYLIHDVSIPLPAGS